MYSINAETGRVYIGSEKAIRWENKQTNKYGKLLLALISMCLYS